MSPLEQTVGAAACLNSKSTAFQLLDSSHQFPTTALPKAIYNQGLKLQSPFTEAFFKKKKERKYQFGRKLAFDHHWK